MNAEEILNKHLAQLEARESRTRTAGDDCAVAIGSAQVMPSGRKETYIEVFAQEGDPAFVCGGDGHITSHLIEEVEKDLEELRAELLDKGDGQYLFTVSYQPAEYGFEGRMESPAYFDLSFVAFQPLPNHILGETHKNLPDENIR